MRVPLAALLRRSVVAGLGLSLALCAPLTSRADTPVEQTVPDSTIAFIKVKNVADLRQALKQTNLGQMFQDEAVKPVLDSAFGRIESTNANVKESLGLTLREILDLPQGTVSLSVMAQDNPKTPVAVYITADAGKNDAKMAELMAKLTKLAEEKGGKVSTDTFQSLALTTIITPNVNNGDGQSTQMPLSWVRKDTTYHIANNADVLKEILSKGATRDDSLGKNEQFAKVVSKVGGDSQGMMYVDITQLVKLASKAADAQGGNAQQVEAMLQILGVNNVKAFGGSINFAKDSFDTVTKGFLYTPGPPQGLLRLFQMPRVELRPEAWVPAAIASYQTLSWDLDGFYEGLNDLVNMFQPGSLAAIEQQLVGPEGGEPIKFQKDIFGPLGDRVSVITDIKKEGGPNSQKMLFAVALEDAKAFQNTINRILAIANIQPKKREFQGNTIYDVEINLPEGGPQSPLSGPLSMTIAKESLFISTDAAMLEQVLRGGGQSLADSTAFQAMVKQLPEKSSSLSYSRSDQSARATYEMLKSGEFQQAIDAAAVGGRPAPKVKELVDLEKLPDFSVFAKYLSNTAGYWQMEEDGLTMTSFSLRKSN